MEFLIQDIIDANQNFTFSFSIDMKNIIKTYNVDVKDCSLVEVKGRAFSIEDNEFVIEIKVTCDLIMQCSVSLEDVSYKLEYSDSEIFGYNNQEDETIILIKGDSINIDDIVNDYVLLNIPIRVVKPEYLDRDNSQIIDDIKDDSPFASLKDLLK